MKKFFTTQLMGLTAAMAVAIVSSPPHVSGPGQGRIPAVHDCFNVWSTTTAPKEAPAEAETAVRKTSGKKLTRLKKSPELSVLYTGAFQSYFEDWEFDFNGGEFLSYDLVLDIDGTEATFTNLFNLEEGYPYDYSTEYEIKGVYDPEAHTVTIPTPREFDKATQAGVIYGYYPATVVCGAVDPDGSITTDAELVFYLSDDNVRLSTAQDFGVMMYSPDGSPQGLKCIYKGGVMLDLEQASEVVCFSRSLDLGRCYVGDTASATLKMFNLSESGSGVEVSSDSDVFSSADSYLEIPPLSVGALGLSFIPEETGVASGILTLSADGDSFDVRLLGECVAAIDYSSLVESGEMAFSTGADFPFELCDYDGHPAARSACAAANGCSSYLTVGFDVEEGDMGRFSWQGVSSSEVAYAALPSIMADGVVVGSFEGLLNTDISGSLQFGAGHHEVSFIYEVGWASYFSENDFMTVYGLSLTSEPLQAYNAELKTPSLRMPNSMLTEESVAKTGTIEIVNLGSEPLRLVSAVNADHFKVQPSSSAVGFLESLFVTVDFSASSAGEYAEQVVLNTTAGDFTVDCSALVREYPDFSQIVKVGDFNFSTDEENPFIVVDGKARNSTAKVDDEKMTYCWLRADFQVPEGKLGKLSWKGLLDTAPIENDMWTDYLTIQVYSSQGTKYTVVPGKYDLNTAYYPYFSEPDMSDLICSPGQCSVTFTYVQYGDGRFSGEDLVEIYDLALELVDTEADSAILDREEVAFPEIYAGKSAQASVRLLNTGASQLEIYTVEGDGVFSGWAPSYPAAYGQSLEVMLYFDPVEAGEHSGVVQIGTSAGVFDVLCTGFARPTDGFILIEDFEDDAAGWTVYDRDGDGDVWDLAFNVYGGFTAGHVHGGEECLVSFSWDYISGSFSPDNWTFSPVFEVPEEGAWLSWWSSGDDNSRPGDVYSVYVGQECPEISQDFDMDSYECVYTETIVSDEWTLHEVDLGAFAGQTVHVAFRHHDCSGCYLVRIDDVYVTLDRQTDVQTLVGNDAHSVSVEYWTPDGVRLNAVPSDGIVIVKTFMSDGSFSTCRLIRN